MINTTIAQDSIARLEAELAEAKIRTASKRFTVEEIRATWPAGILTHVASVRLSSGEMATIESRASIYHGPRSEPVLILSSAATTVYGNWKSFSSVEPGDVVGFTARGLSAERLAGL